MNIVNEYKIEHKILTLAQCAVMEKKDKPASFDADGVEFSHWDFNYRDGWITNAWIANTTIRAENYHKAFGEFINKLSRLVSRISLISQSYIEYLSEPFLIHKISSDIAFFRYTIDVGGGGLMFMEGEQRALKKLLENEEIPESFYYYWNDAVNTIGYSAKLLLMFSSLEAFARKRDKNKFKRSIDFYVNILGDELADEIFAKKNGLRNRLIHGEYFTGQDPIKNYLDLVHNKIIDYFNAKVFSEILIPSHVAQPQRHFFGNKEGFKSFIKIKNGSNFLNLKDLLQDFSDGKFRTPEKYEFVYDVELNTDY